MPRRPIGFAVPFVACALAAPAARAQVNTEALRSDLESRARYVAVQASFAGHTGNTEGVVGSGAAFAGATFGRHLVFLKVQGDYASFSGAATIAKAFAHGRYNVDILPFLAGEVFVQVEADKFERLALRQVDGVGVRFGLVHIPDVRLYYGTSWMLDYEKLDGQFVFGGGPEWFAQRWNNYLAVSWKMNKRARLTETFYIQPRFNGFYDYRILNDVAFVIDIDKRFSAKVDCQVHHNSTPPAHVLPTDLDTTTSLVLTL